MGILKIKVRELCAIDIRSLALFRMGLALILIYDLLARLTDLKAHYSDSGVLPRHVLISKILSSWDLSLHMINGTWQFQCLLFLISLSFALMLLVGYKTKIATVMSWILLISLHARNPIVLQGGDIVLRVLLFWSIFLPLGALWSFDRYQLKEAPRFWQISSLSSLGLLLQVCFIYWFTVLLKTDESWRESGTAVWYALSIEQYATYLGVYLLNFPKLLKILTFATFYLEAFVPFLAFSPIWTPQLRCATFVIFAAFHLIALNLTMELAHFSYICTVAWIVFIPKGFWDKVLKTPGLNEEYAHSRYATNMMALFFLLYILIWNVKTLEGEFPEWPEACEVPGIILGIDQCWNMFAPYPLKEDGWYVIPALLKDSSRIDLYTQDTISYEKPSLLSKTYKNDRWRSYMMNMFLQEDGYIYLAYYADYLTQEWNRNNPPKKELHSFQIEYMCYFNHYNVPRAQAQKILLWDQKCP